MHDATPIVDLAEYARHRDALLDRIVDVLQADPRVDAVWLSGSYGRGEADEWSDFDLHVAVADEHFEQFLAERPELYTRVGRPILVQQEIVQSDSMPGGRFQLVLYSGPFEVDWNIGPVSLALRHRAFRMLIERVAIPVVSPPPLTPVERRAHADKWLTFFWAMAPIAVGHTARAETRRAAGQIDLLSRALIALWRLLAQPEGPDPHLPSTNPVLEPEIDARLPRLGPVIDPLGALQVIRALCDEVVQLHPRLAALGVSIPSDVPGEVAELSALAEAVIRRGAQPRRKYR